jgi:hypothetical protein
MKYCFSILLSISCLFSFGQESSFFKIIDNDSADALVDAVQLSSGDYFILSNTETSNGSDFQVTKADGLGNTDWAYTYGTSDADFASSMTSTSDGGLLVSGYTEGVLGSTHEDGFVLKLNSSGTVQWTRFVRMDSNSRLMDVIQTRAGDIFVTGYVQTDSLDKDIVVAQFSSVGSERWVRTIGGKGDFLGEALGQDSRGNIIVAGSTTSDSINAGTNGDMDAYIAIIDGLGTVVTAKSFGTSSDDEAKFLVTDNQKIYVGGNTDGGNLGGQDLFLLELDTNLNEQNSAGFGSSQDDEIKDLYLNDNNNPFIVFSGGSNQSLSDISIFESSFSSFGGINGSIFGGISQDGTSGAKLTGNQFLGYSMIGSGNSFVRNNNEGIFIAKTDEFLATTCNFNFDLVSDGNISMQANNYSQIELNGFTSTFNLTRTSVTNTDTMNCCQLEALVLRDSVTICTGESVRIGRSSITGYTYSWSTLSGDVFTNGSANPEVFPTQSTFYKLVVSDADGECISDSAFIYVTVNQRMQVDQIADTFSCEGDSLTLIAQSGMNFYEWTSGAQKFNSASIIIKDSAELTLQMIDNNSCIYLDTVVVDFKEIPVFSLGSDTTICDNAELNIVGPADMDEYRWNGTIGSQSLTISTANTYELIGTDSFGCTGSDEIQVLTNPSSPFSLGADTTICDNQELVIFIPSALSNYTWNGQASNDFEFTVSAAGTYIGAAQNSFGCITADTIVIAEHPGSAFSLGNDTGFCDAITFQLSGPIGMSDYEWSDNSALPILNINAAGTYWLKIEDVNGCVYSDSIDIDLNTSPTIDLGDDRNIPLSGVLVLSPGEDFSNYDWSTGESSSSIQVTDTGRYSVTVTDENGCTAFDEVYVPGKAASIQTLNGIQYKLFPNPAQNALFITTERQWNEAGVSLLDATGRVIQSQLVNGSRCVLDVSDLSNGIYKVILQEEENTLFFNVVIAH